MVDRLVMKTKSGVGVTYQLEKVRCGKKSCGRLHGPYWYAYARSEGRLRKRYIGRAFKTVTRSQVLGRTSGKVALGNALQRLRGRLPKVGLFAAAMLVACSTHGPNMPDAASECRWCDAGLPTLQDASEDVDAMPLQDAAALDASEDVDAMSLQDAAALDASEDVDAMPLQDAAAFDASEDVDAREPHPLNEVCTAASVAGGLCASAQCESACMLQVEPWLTVCCDDPRFPGGAFLCWCAP